VDLVPFYLFVSETGTQRTDEYHFISDGVLAEWANQAAFEADGWTLEQVGGFKLKNKKLVFDAALKAEHDTKLAAALITPATVLHQLQAWAAAKPVAWKFKWAAQIALVESHLLWWANPAVGTATKATVLELVGALRQLDGVDEAEIATIEAAVEAVQG
jgi:hypothetical protein